MTTTKVLYFADVARGDRRWATHFLGRPGCTRTLVGRESYAADAGHAAGVYIEVTPDLGDAWDRAGRAVRAIPRSVPTGEANALAVAIIERELDAVAPRTACWPEVRQ